jgi:sirohydrochlorin ferrochelatase
MPTRAAYLDLTDPDLTAVALELASEGHRSAVVVPLLFTPAFHATIDVPDAIAAASAASGLDLQLAAILGTGDDLADVLAAVMAEFGVGAGESVLLFAVGSSDVDANAALDDLAARLAARRHGPVRVGFGTAAPRADAVLDDLTASGADMAAIVIVPLFVAPGLLLDPVQAKARERGWVTTPPLAERVAPIVARRYRDRTAVPSSLG